MNCRCFGSLKPTGVKVSREKCCPRLMTRTAGDGGEECVLWHYIKWEWRVAAQRKMCFCCWWVAPQKVASRHVIIWSTVTAASSSSRYRFIYFQCFSLVPNVFLFFMNIFNGIYFLLNSLILFIGIGKRRKWIGRRGLLLVWNRPNLRWKVSTWRGIPTE